MSATIYTVTFTDLTGTEVISRFFQKLSAARTWVSYLNGTAYAKDAKIYRGGAGGELVK